MIWQPLDICGGEVDKPTVMHIYMYVHHIAGVYTCKCFLEEGNRFFKLIQTSRPKMVSQQFNFPAVQLSMKPLALQCILSPTFVKIRALKMAGEFLLHDQFCTVTYNATY